MNDMVNIEGLNKADVLAALYNASKPVGMGFLQAGKAPLNMDRSHAERLLAEGSAASGDYPVDTLSTDEKSLDFDYLYGRPLKVDLSSNIEFYPWGFDRDNGGTGAAQRVIDRLRETGDVLAPDNESFSNSQVNENDALLFLLGALKRNQR